MNRLNDYAVAVLFEVIPAPGRRTEYLDLAAALLSRLQTMEGFLSVERFQSLSQPNKILSLSVWANEEAVARWRNLEVHRAAQERGRGGVFTDYRLRVAHVVRDYGMTARTEAPRDSRAHHS